MSASRSSDAFVLSFSAVDKDYILPVVTLFGYPTEG